MKLVSICDWLPPDFGAVGQYALAKCREQAAAGNEMTLIGLTSGSDAESVERIGSGSLRTLRLAARAYDRADFRARAWWTLRTNLRLVRRAWSAMAAADEILFAGAPPFLLHLLVPGNGLLRKRLVYRITDFHPECLMAELGVSPWWLRAFYRLTVDLRREVDRFEVLGDDQRRRLLEIGIPADRIVLARDAAPVEITADTAPLPIPEALRGKVVLLYSGNFGVAHDDATFVEGYARHHHHGSGRVALWLNATGAKADRVEAALRARQLPVHRSQPVALAELSRLLVTPAAHLITLRDAFVGFVLPSKVYGCIASGRSVLFVGSVASDVHALCAAALSEGRYHRVAEGDAEGVAAALEAIARRADEEQGTPMVRAADS